MSTTQTPPAMSGTTITHLALRQAAANAGVPLRDRYGFATFDDWLEKAVRLARDAETVAIAAEALEMGAWMHEFELASADSLSLPINAAEAHTLAMLFRGPLGETAVA